MMNKPRNHVVLAMLKAGKKSSVHGKTKKAQRRQDKMALKKGSYE